MNKLVIIIGITIIIIIIIVVIIIRVNKSSQQTTTPLVTPPVISPATLPVIPQPTPSPEMPNVEQVLSQGCTVSPECSSLEWHSYCPYYTTTAEYGFTCQNNITGEESEILWTPGYKSNDGYSSPDILMIKKDPTKNWCPAENKLVPYRHFSGAPNHIKISPRQQFSSGTVWSDGTQLKLTQPWDGKSSIFNDTIWAPGSTPGAEVCNGVQEASLGQI